MNFSSKNQVLPFYGNFASVLGVIEGFFTTSQIEYDFLG